MEAGEEAASEVRGQPVCREAEAASVTQEAESVNVNIAPYK